jgi:hypothetical protein
MVVVTGGNEGSSSEPHIGAPADAVSVITIGAVDPMRQELHLVPLAHLR